MKKTFSVFLSLIILFSSFNFKLSAHYCGQQLVDVALFGKAEPCQMAMGKCSDSDEEPCCADRDLIIEGEDYLSTKDFKKHEIKKTEDLVAILEFPVFLLIEEQNVAYNTIKYSPPPILSQNYQALFQSFLL